jgi:hypothetical protein
MKTLEMGQQLPSSGNMYLRVKEKGDQITFRIAQNPVYTGKHFLPLADGKWDVFSCPRINEGTECETCEMYFKAKAEAKKLKDAGDKKATDADNEARKYSCAISFYFPVLNRDTEEMGILQVTQGVRNQINAKHEAGVKVFERDWTLMNTGKVGKERYFVDTIDSSEVKPLTEKEDIELTKALAFDLSTLNDGSSTADEIEE